MRHQFVFSSELGLRLRFPTFVRRTFDSVRGTMTRNNYEKANAKRTEPVPNENRSVTPRKLWLTDGRLGDWEYCHDDRRQHSSFCFKYCCKVHTNRTVVFVLYFFCSLVSINLGLLLPKCSVQAIQCAQSKSTRTVRGSICSFMYLMYSTFTVHFNLHSRLKI